MKNTTVVLPNRPLVKRVLAAMTHQILAKNATICPLLYLLVMSLGALAHIGSYCNTC
jgi:hypothetical protein